VIVPTPPVPDELARHLTVITTPPLWVAWPFLPLARRTAGGTELGVLFDARGAADLTGYSATVFAANLFALPATLAALLALPRDVHDTAEELLAAGWRLD
jgi:hypothetical protein